MKPARSGSKIRVMLVEDHVLVRTGLISAINLEPDIEVVAEAEEAEQAVKSFRRYWVDVVVLDLGMRSIDGVQIMRKLRGELGPVRILALSRHGGIHDIACAVQEGACGCIARGMELDHLLEGIRTVHAGGEYFPHEIARRIAESTRSEESRRELPLRPIANETATVKSPVL